MAKSKVSASKVSYDTSSDSAYEHKSKVSYAKLIKIASIQQDELDSLTETIKKSKILLIDEMERSNFN